MISRGIKIYKTGTLLYLYYNYFGVIMLYWLINKEYWKKDQAQHEGTPHAGALPILQIVLYRISVAFSIKC